MDDMKCSLCGYPLTRFYRRADPVCDGVCCQRCFAERVIPARAAKVKAWEDEERRFREWEDGGNRNSSKPAVREQMKPQSECPTGKICYKKKEDAEFALYECRRNSQHSNARNEKSVYFCQLCGSFHLTSHDRLPSWSDRNRAVNYKNSPFRYIPPARQENW